MAVFCLTLGASTMESASGATAVAHGRGAMTRLKQHSLQEFAPFTFAPVVLLRTILASKQSVTLCHVTLFALMFTSLLTFPWIATCSAT